MTLTKALLNSNLYAMRPVSATINLMNLAHNYRLLQAKSSPSKVMAIIKANAYGHGLLPVAETLYNEGCRSFAVTDAQEGLALRAAFPLGQHDKVDILLLSGLFDESDALLSQQQQLTPVLSEHDQLELLKKVGFTGHIWLKLDTGMSRIGVADLEVFVEHIRQSPVQLAGIMSHLACADTPEHPLNQLQIQSFRTLQQTSDFPAYSLLNSAGIVAFSDLKTDFVRPGIALYGAEPIPTRPLGLKPVMQLSGHIKQVRSIQAGDSVSYGATWVAREDTDVAVVALGYADGLPRLLSNQGEALHHSGRLPIIGRVCMDYCLLAVKKELVAVGDEVIFFGFANGAPLASDVAHQAQTIPYELFTGISNRVSRRYIKENV